MISARYGLFIAILVLLVGDGRGPSRRFVQPASGIEAAAPARHAAIQKSELAARPAAERTPDPATSSKAPEAGTQLALVTPQGVTAWTCGVTIEGSSGTTVDVTYAGLPGNQPNAYGNTIAIWDSSVVPWTVPPLKKDAILRNQQSGSHVLFDISISRTAYTVGYSVGPASTDVCASALLNADGSNGATDGVAISLASVGTDSLSVRYHTLSGYLPAQAGNWIGLWAGRASPFNAPTPLAKLKIPADVTDAVVGLNGVSLDRGEPYTVIYFLGEQLTTAAALLEFTTSP